MCGYRRPKNLRDLLVRAKVPHQTGDEIAMTPHTRPSGTAPEPEPSTSNTLTSKTKQKSIMDFLVPGVQPTPGTARNQTISSSGRLGTDPSKRGMKFCNTTNCRYCPLLNRTGFIHSHTTGIRHSCMTNISCRSSNLIYAISCKICGIQYVGQTSVRIKDRFVHHFRDIEMSNQEKSVGRHFSGPDHHGFKDLHISALEFIKAPPKSPRAIQIRNRVEKNWTYQLRSLAPQGLNMESPKEFGPK